jgi:hypothetical protein
VTPALAVLLRRGLGGAIVGGGRVPPARLSGLLLLRAGLLLSLLLLACLLARLLLGLLLLASLLTRLLLGLLLLASLLTRLLLGLLLLASLLTCLLLGLLLLASLLTRLLLGLLLLASLLTAPLLEPLLLASLFTHLLRVALGLGSLDLALTILILKARLTFGRRPHLLVLTLPAFGLLPDEVATAIVGLLLGPSLFGDSPLSGGLVKAGLTTQFRPRAALWRLRGRGAVAWRDWVGIPADTVVEARDAGGC